MKHCFKKGVALVLTVLMVMSCFTAIISAAALDYDKCPHANPDNYVASTEYHAPTCTAFGYDQINYCYDCEHYYVPDDHVILMVDHAYALASHEHTIDGSVDGVVNTYKCATCDKTYAEDGANWTKTGVDADCITDGVVNYVCAHEGCDVAIEKVPVVADGHDYWLDYDNLVPPTCATEGSLPVYCHDCDFTCVVTIEKMSATGTHSFGKVLESKEATCDADGYVTYECDKCYEVWTEVLPALGHDFQNTRNDCYDYCTRCDAKVHTTRFAEHHEQAPTCGTWGFKYDMCLKCGENVGAMISWEPLGHKNTKEVDVVPGDCVTDRVYNIVCADCGEVLEENKVEKAIGHVEGEWITTIEATCIAGGHEILLCKVCGHLLEERDTAINEYNHDIVDYEMTTPPTCTEYGVVSIHCRRCSLKDYQTSDPADPNLAGKNLDPSPLNHMKDGKSCYVVTYSQEMNCVQDGYKTETCTECGDSRQKAGSFVARDPFAHNMDNATLDLSREDDFREPDCYHGWFKYFVCGDCHREFATYVGEPNPHQFVITPGVEPDCENKGVTEKKVCSACTYTEGGEEIPALGHIIEKVTAAKYACWEGWSADGEICTREGCDYNPNNVYYHGVDHDLTAVVVKTADCENDGFTFVGCKICGPDYICAASKITNYVYFFRHEYEPVLVVAPTCTEEGYTGYACTKCGDYKKEDYVDATGHLNAAGKQIVQCYVGDPTVAGDDNVCVVCGPIDVHAGFWNVTHMPSTCIHDYTYDLYFCSNCMYQKVENIQESEYGDHIAGAPVVVKEPTHTEKGLKKTYCKLCGIELSSEEIPALTGLVFTSDVYAYNYNTGSFTDDKFYFVNSGYIAVKVNVMGSDVDFWGVQMALEYNNDVLVFDKDLTDSYNIDNENMSFVFSASEGKVTIVAAHTVNEKKNYNLNGEEQFATLFFKVNTDGYGKTVDFAIDTTACKVIDAEDVELTECIYNAIDSKYIYQLGDVNYDGKIDISDAQNIMAMLAAPGEDTLALADIDKNGTVQIVDFLYLQEIIADYINYDSYIQ